MLRIDLAYQKKYLMVLLARFEKEDKKIVALISQIGFPVATSAPARKRKTLKTIALSVVFLQRAR